MEIKREHYLNKLIRKKDNGRVKIITGIRRCGKSYLLFGLYKRYLLENGVNNSEIIELPLDDIDNTRYRNPFELNSYVKERTADPSKRYYVFIDEVQMSAEVSNPYAPETEAKITFIDAVLGLMKRPNLDIYVTGSNSKMLSREVLTQFRDRGDEIHISPLSYAELCSAFPDRQHLWREFCTYGGMPLVWTLDTPQEKSAYLKDLCEETYIKDIIERNKIRNDREALDVLLDFVASSIGSLTNPNKLEKRFLSEQKIKISHATIARYLDFFREAYVLDSVKRFDVKGAKFFDTPLKYYFSDIGLRNARLNFRQIEENHIMENVIYNDLIRRGCNVDVGMVQGTSAAGVSRSWLEVDFVVNRGNDRCYIQSALNIDSETKHEQETASLRRIDDSFKKIVIVRDDIEPRYDEKGIFYIGIRDFLLDQNLLER